MGGRRGRGGRRPWFPCCENIQWFQMCTFFNRADVDVSRAKILMHHSRLKLWYSFYISVEYQRLHENNLAKEDNLSE